MSYINCRIVGEPYGGSGRRRRGFTEGPSLWTTAVKSQTRGLPPIKEACLMKVTFLLPKNRFPGDFPYGPDLDNLLKRFLDALRETVFSEAKGCDSCVISMVVTKTRVPDGQKPGVHLEILPVAIL